LKVTTSVLALVAALFALALPAAASAEVIIDSTADEPDLLPGGACQTLAGECTLRAAIEVTNAAGTAQDVFFDDEFNGQLADTIELTLPLPAIQAPVSLNGGSCPLGSLSRPCAGVSGPAGSPGITVEADGVTIAHLSVTGAQVGIDVIDESQDFTASGNWIGVKLDGNAGPNKTGIFIGPGSDGATIWERNVIAGNESEGVANEGIDIEGASNAVIRGNYFGVAPDGTTRMPNGTDIEMTDSTTGGGFPAADNEIGNTIEGAPLVSEACDGGCNVISGASKGINLEGFESSEAPASGPTLVHGNYIGLDAAGSGAIVNSQQGVSGSEADQLTVGGLGPTETNYFAGGGKAIVAEGENLEVLGNSIGIAPDGSDLPAASEAGVLVSASSVSEEPSIEGNEIRMDGAPGIRVFFATGRIVGNHLEGGSSGIQTSFGSGGGLIAGNEIASPTDYGILVESPDNEVRANTIADSAGIGIGVVNRAGPATNGNLIGGNTAERENTIDGSHDAAIEILEEATEPGSTTEVARNRGSENGGLFIDLVAGANEGILPPTFAVSQQSSASGTAEPAARVRVFRKASAEAGELQSFLGEAVADGSGKWKVTYPKQIPVGTLVAATQTSVAGGTSELKVAMTIADPLDECLLPEGCDKRPTGIVDPPCAFTASKCRWPETVITWAPRAKTHARTVTFRFSSDMAGSTFECKLDKRPFRRCRSPKKYKRLKPGKHVFKVRATDTQGRVDPVPAKKKFRVLP
jgi:Right handed beta helix region